MKITSPMSLYGKNDSKNSEQKFGMNEFSFLFILLFNDFDLHYEENP